MPMSCVCVHQVFAIGRRPKCTDGLTLLAPPAQTHFRLKTGHAAVKSAARTADVGGRFDGVVQSAAAVVDVVDVVGVAFNRVDAGPITSGSFFEAAAALAFGADLLHAPGGSINRPGSR